jgi:hypothetical protein
MRCAWGARQLPGPHSFSNQNETAPAGGKAEAARGRYNEGAEPSRERHGPTIRHSELRSRSP